ncbi:MAG: recombinase family protein [Clostridia bacterium]|nr:recombinase family protein [Clostridia bacterium]
MKQKKESSDVMKIAAYARVSTEKESQVESFEKQIEFFNEFTKKNGYELYKLYADEGISGKQIKHRKQFQQMMQDAKLKKFDKVVVKDVSRFARNTVDLLQSIRELKSYGIEVDFLNNGEIMEGGSEFILTILGAMAQQESANMSKRVKFGKDITAQKGRVPNLVFGYDKIPDERYTLKINEEEAKIVKEIFESYVYKGFGTTKIAWSLNDRGIRTKKTKSKWVQTSIVRMLKNPIYTGRVTNKKSEVTDFITGTRKELPEEEWIVVERPEMRIISDELFNRAQALLEQRSNEFKLNNKREKTEYVFSTLIYCKHCGYSFRRMKRKYSADGKEYIRWVCSGRNSMGVNHCPNTTTIDEEELLNAIKIYLKSIISNKKNFMKSVEKEFEKITKLRETKERSEESLLQEIEKVTVKKQKYMEMFQNEVIDIQELKKYTNPLNEDIARLERELKLITSEIKEKDVLQKELSKTINTVDDILNNQTITNAMLKTIIDVIEVDDDANIEVRLKLLNEIGTNEPVVTRFEDIYNCESNGNNENNLNNKNNSNNTENENNKNNANNKNNTNNQNSTVTESNIST